jgi:hypothetical protein
MDSRLNARFSVLIRRVLRKALLFGRLCPSGNLLSAFEYVKDHATALGVPSPQGKSPKSRPPLSAIMSPTNVGMDP